MRALRDILIIMVLALGVAFLPGGGNAADTVLTALTMGFLAGIAWMLYGLSRQNELTLATLSDFRRGVLYCAFGLIALLIAGYDEMFHSGSGTLAWIVLFGLSLAAIWRIWLEANTYS